MRAKDTARSLLDGVCDASVAKGASKAGYDSDESEVMVIVKKSSIVCIRVVAAK